MRGLLIAPVMIAALIAAAPVARAEALSVEGVYPADSDAAAALRSIAVESFGGSDGSDLAIRIGDALQQVAIDGQPYFRVLPGGGAADGVLRGTATAEITRSRYGEKRDRCVAKDDNGKCTERAREEVRCTRRTIELVPNLRLLARTGTLIYAYSEPERLQDSRCEDDSSQFRSQEAIVREFSDKIAGKLRGSLAPSQRRESIRVIEDRKGLAKGDGDRFRNALRLTKTDAGAACRQWQAIAEANPAHGATLFNVGLCDEAAGDLDRAEQAYRRAAQLSRAGDIASGLRRIEARRRAAAQLAAHFRR